MLGLDDQIAGFSDGTTLLIVIAIAILLGLRHASDPDHLAAVTTLIASKKEGTARLAGLLGFSWGLGHATSLLPSASRSCFTAPTYRKRFSRLGKR
jgi:high-affinity nickel permease